MGLLHMSSSQVRPGQRLLFELIKFDSDEGGPFQYSYVHVDAKHDRVRHMKT